MCKALVMGGSAKQFKKVLVANRGEIAVRVMRCLREMGLRSCAVHSSIDAEAIHSRLADERIPIGPAHPLKSYLNSEAIIAAARECGADAVHPGYGFLAENWRFAEECERAGIKFVGPPAEALRLLGDKTAARRIAASQGVPLIPGTDGPVDPAEDPTGMAGRIGYPLMVKAAMGGGGKGMRIVRDEPSLRTALEAAARESAKSFGDASVYVEKYIERARHVEFQVLGDSRGGFAHLFDRECSIQRRHQKLVEEAPAPGLDDKLRALMAEAAVAVARAAGCSNASTVEFLLCPDGAWYFLEVNPRIQVEHPVTELVTGVDLVREQLLLAMGNPLSACVTRARPRGSALECRVMAEDPARGFAPAPGRILFMKEPSGPGIRVDSGFEAGAEIPVEYDPILSKVITCGSGRAEAAARMSRALSEFVVLGIPTTIPFLKQVIGHEAFRRGSLHTGFIEEHFSDFGSGPGPKILEALVAAVAGIIRDRGGERRGGAGGARSFDPWQDLGGWQLGER